jgi:hypothetical protein
VKRLLIAVVAAVFGLAAPASAFTPPELFVRQQPWDTHEAVGDWIPLASAPALDYLAGYQIGYRLQASGQPNEFQRAALTVAGVPDGQPTQPYNAEPYCVGQAGTVGQIVTVGSELQFEGDGTYTVKVSVGAGSGGASGCLSGETTTASFSVVTRVAPSVAGEPLSFRADPLPFGAFAGVQAPDPPGGRSEVRCALDAGVQPDGSVKGALVAPDPELELVHGMVSESAFTRPGAWTCVARGVAEGRDAEFERTDFGTPWSAPLTFDVRSDFRRKRGVISHPRAKRVQFTFTAEWPAFAPGGRGTVTLYRFTGCGRGHSYKGRRVARSQGRFDARRMQLKLRRPRRAGLYFGRFAFSGTRFLRASTDPNLLYLDATRRRLLYAGRFPAC